ncbi:MAG: hypothetical protein J6D26_00540 [Clostridia bacterium]|nr:hypothetical protein [Clostridia bacterium]
MNTIKIDSRGVKVIAHRGLSGIEAENTNAAFVAAGNRSYWGIETDVHVAKDGTLIIIHDSNAERVTDVDMVVENAAGDELKKLRIIDKYDGAPRSDLTLPTLDEYIRICKKYDKIAVLELKEAMKAEDILRIYNLIKSADYLDKTVFISFCFDNLAEIKKINPNQKVQFLVKEWSIDLVSKLKQSGMDLDIRYKALTADRVEELHKYGIEVNCWTVDEKETAHALISYGVDYITTNILE